MTYEINVENLQRMSGDTYKFERIGAKLSGIISQVSDPFHRVNKFNDQPEEVYPIGITPDGGTQQLIWPVKRENGASPMLQAIVDAVVKAGAKSYALGGRLAVVYTEDRDLGKGNPMKIYAAKYEPPAAAATVDDLF